jgi:hypothetical protein
VPKSYPLITYTVQRRPQTETPANPQNASPQQEYNMKPNYETVRSAAQVQEKKKTATERVY